jgi:hypothetical protein
MVYGGNPTHLLENLIFIYSNLNLMEIFEC